MARCRLTWQPSLRSSASFHLLASLDIVDPLFALVACKPSNLGMEQLNSHPFPEFFASASSSAAPGALPLIFARNEST